MNALKLVLVVNSCAPIQSGHTTVAVTPDTDWTLMDILAMVYTPYDEMFYYNNIILHSTCRH